MFKLRACKLCSILAKQIAEWYIVEYFEYGSSVPVFFWAVHDFLWIHGFDWADTSVETEQQFKR